MEEHNLNLQHLMLLKNKAVDESFVISLKEFHGLMIKTAAFTDIDLKRIKEILKRLGTIVEYRVWLSFGGYKLSVKNIIHDFFLFLYFTNKAMDILDSPIMIDNHPLGWYQVDATIGFTTEELSQCTTIEFFVPMEKTTDWFHGWVLLQDCKWVKKHRLVTTTVRFLIS